MTHWERIEPLVNSSGLTMKQLAAIAKVVPSAVNKWKAGAQIRFASLLRIADYFGVPIDSLGNAEVNIVRQYQNSVRESSVQQPSAEDLKARIADLERQLERANETIASQARTIEAMQGRAAAVPAAGARSGGTASKPADRRAAG